MKIKLLDRYIALFSVATNDYKKGRKSSAIFSGRMFLFIFIGTYAVVLDGLFKINIFNNVLYLRELSLIYLIIGVIILRRISIGPDDIESVILQLDMDNPVKNGRITILLLIVILILIILLNHWLKI